MIELIEKILSHDIHEAEKKFPSELERLGWELFGIKPCGCGFRLIEIYIKLHKNGIHKAKAMKDIKRTARLKDNIVLRIPQMGITWTNLSMDFTDERAIEVLKNYKAFESKFEILPVGYGDILEPPKAVEKPEPKKSETPKKSPGRKKKVVPTYDNFTQEEKTNS